MHRCRIGPEVRTETEVSGCVLTAPIEHGREARRSHQFPRSSTRLIASGRDQLSSAPRTQSKMRVWTRLSVPLPLMSRLYTHQTQYRSWTNASWPHSRKKTPRSREQHRRSRKDLERSIRPTSLTIRLTKRQSKSATAHSDSSRRCGSASSEFQGLFLRPGCALRDIPARISEGTF